MSCNVSVRVNLLHTRVKNCAFFFSDDPSDSESNVA